MWICKKCGVCYDEKVKDFPRLHSEVCDGIVVREEETGSIWSSVTGGAE